MLYKHHELVLAFLSSSKNILTRKMMSHGIKETVCGILTQKVIPIDLDYFA